MATDIMSYEVTKGIVEFFDVRQHAHERMVRSTARARLFSPWYGAALYDNQFKGLRKSSGMLSDTFVVPIKSGGTFEE